MRLRRLFVACVALLATACATNATLPVEAPDPGREPVKSETPGSDAQSPQSPALSQAEPPDSEQPDSERPEAPTVRGPQRLERGTLLYGMFVLDTETGDVLDTRTRGHMFWSPQGHVLLDVDCCEEGGLTVIDLEAGTADKLDLPMPTMAVWAPDGERLAFGAFAGQIVPGPIMTAGVYIVNRDGSDLRQLTDDELYSHLAWSGDGRYISYQQRPRDDSVLAVIDAESGERLLTAPIGPGHFPIVTWEPAGSRLAWTDVSNYNVFDAATGERLAVPLADPIAQLFWDTDGGLHVLTADPSPEEVSYTVQHTTPAGSTVTHGPVHWRTPALAPSGEQLAYITNGCMTETFDLVVGGADGSPARALTADGEAKIGPVWRPDGGAIAFGKHRSVAVVDVITGEQQTFVRDYELYGTPRIFGWSADGRYLIFRIDKLVVCTYD